MAQTTSFHALAARLVEEFDGARRVIPIASLATGSGATSLVITEGPASGAMDYGYSSLSANAFDGLHVWITVPDAAATAPAGEYGGQVTRGGNSAGTLTISPGFSADPNSADTGAYLMLTKLPPFEYLRAAQSIQRDQFMPRYLCLSVCNDANMEDASGDVATDWPDSTGTPTQTKDTTEVLTGKQSLKIVTTTLDHSVRSPSIPVTEADQWLFAPVIKCTAGSLRAQLYDVTNSAEIDGVTVDEEDWTQVYLQPSIPADCQNVQVRFIAKTAATTAYVDHVPLTTSRGIYAVPSQVADANDILGVTYSRYGLGSEAGNSYMALSEVMEAWPYFDYLRDYAGVNSHRIQVRKPCAHPLYLHFRAAETIFTGINATTGEVTYVPQEIAVAGGLAHLYMTIGKKEEADRYAGAYGTRLRGIGLGAPVVKRSAQRRVWAS